MKKNCLEAVCVLNQVNNVSTSHGTEFIKTFLATLPYCCWCCRRSSMYYLHFDNRFYCNHNFYIATSLFFSLAQSARHALVCLQKNARTQQRNTRNAWSPHQTRKGTLPRSWIDAVTISSSRFTLIEEIRQYPLISCFSSWMKTYFFSLVIFSLFTVILIQFAVRYV